MISLSAVGCFWVEFNENLLQKGVDECWRKNWRSEVIQGCLNEIIGNVVQMTLLCESPRRVVERARFRDSGRVAPAYLHLGRERQVS